MKKILSVALFGIFAIWGQTMATEIRYDSPLTQPLQDFGNALERCYSATRVSEMHHCRRNTHVTFNTYWSATLVFEPLTAFD